MDKQIPTPAPESEIDQAPIVEEPVAIPEPPAKKVEVEEPEDTTILVKVDGCSKLAVRSKPRRPGPGKPDNVIGTVDRGELGRIDGKDSGEFVKVVFNNGVKGYAMKKYLVQA